jgi:nitronate monooxygenase
MNRDPLPTIIQGGMGAGVSGWSLARSVSKAGHLGVVSGTAMDVILARRLQLGDPGGHMRRALERFPIPNVAQRILDRYYIPGGKLEDKPFRAKPVPAEKPSRHLEELLVAGNFVEVFLARAIPGVLDRLAQGQPVELRLDVQGAGRSDEFTTRFDPNSFCGGEAPDLVRPDFLAIVSSATLANMLARKASGRVNGFVVEAPTAGGHNAPPRGRLQLSVEGEPIYGERDVPDLEAIRALGLPFWLAGSYAEPARVAEALRLGAAGVQIGTAFAYCEESGLDHELKERVLAMSHTGGARVFADPIASPTGFPFKVLQMEDTHSDSTTYEKRTRICDLGYLRHAYKRSDGTLGWRCPGEPVEEYVRKGGEEEDTRGRRCVCNGLMANIGLGQIHRGGEQEKPLVTSGDDVTNVARFLKPGACSYRAVDVIDYLMQDTKAIRLEPDECATP